MQEIATAMTAADLPDGFHWAAAEIFRRASAAPEPVVRASATEVVLAHLAGHWE
jgi:hypothetical protein